MHAYYYDMIYLLFIIIYPRSKSIFITYHLCILNFYFINGNKISLQQYYSPLYIYTSSYLLLTMHAYYIYGLSKVVRVHVVTIIQNSTKKRILIQAANADVVKLATKNNISSRNTMVYRIVTRVNTLLVAFSVERSCDLIIAASNQAQDFIKSVLNFTSLAKGSYL